MELKLFGNTRDLTGQRFGKLVVVNKSNVKKDGRLHWLCKCDCGKTKTISGRNLRTGRTQSCGCLSSKNLIGSRFGRLIVLEEVEERSSNGSKKWLCKCDCGTEKVISGDFLKSGQTKSCGCLRLELAIPVLAKGSNADAVEFTRTSLLTAKISANNTSGVKGVSFDKRSNKWNAYLTLKGTRVLNKLFDDKQDAINARKEAEEKYFKPILDKYEQK